MQDKQINTSRQYIVEPANSQKEAVYVLAAVMALLLAVAVRVLLMPETNKPLLLEAYQRIDNSLSEAERPLYQAFLSSQNEIVSLWEERSSWPTVAELDEEGIPPFALDFMAGDFKKYVWTRYDRGPWVDYIGISSVDSVKMPSAILRIINLHEDFHPHPHPGKDYDPGQRAAVQIWLHPESSQKYPGMRLAERGWFWIISSDDPILQVKKNSD